MLFQQWVRRWNIPAGALMELEAMIGTEYEVKSAQTLMSNIPEVDMQSLVRIETSKMGWRLWRNNIGAGELANGDFIRWGLCNESRAMNKNLKSSDLVGIRPVQITEAHVGETIGQFCGIEIKKGDWMYSGDEHEQAQNRWMMLVRKLGGYAKFVNNVNDVKGE